MPVAIVKEMERGRERERESKKKKKSFLKVSGILVYIQPFKATTAYNNIAYGIKKKDKKKKTKTEIKSQSLPVGGNELTIKPNSYVFDVIEG